MCDVFIHSVYINSGKMIFYSPRLFKTNLSSLEKSENSEQINKIIENAIKETLSSMIPLENILKEYIGNIYESGDIENEENSDEENSEEGSKNGESVYCNKEESDEEHSEEESDEEESDEEDKDKIINIGDKIKEERDPFCAPDEKIWKGEENENEENENEENENEENSEENSENSEENSEEGEEEESDKESPEIPLEIGPTVDNSKLKDFDRKRMKSKFKSMQKKKHQINKFF
jgi:hypothetical protein